MYVYSMSSYEHFLLRSTDAVVVKNTLASDYVLPSITSNTARQLRIDFVDFFNTFDNVTTSNNKFYLTVNGVDVYYTVPVGLYTIDTLLETLKGLIKTAIPLKASDNTSYGSNIDGNNAGTVFTIVMFKYVKLEIATPSNTTFSFKASYSTNNINMLLGFKDAVTFDSQTVFTAYIKSKQSLQPYNLIPVRNLYICSNALSKFETTYKVTSDKFPGLFLTIPITCAIGERMVFKPKKSVNYPPKTSQYIDIQLRDENGELLDFRNNFLNIKGTMFSTSETLV